MSLRLSDEKFSNVQQIESTGVLKAFSHGYPKKVGFRYETFFSNQHEPFTYYLFYIADLVLLSGDAGKF